MAYDGLLRHGKCDEKTAEKRRHSQACFCPILKCVIGGPERCHGMTRDQAYDHVRSSRMIGVGRQDNGRSALDIRNTREIHYDHIAAWIIASATWIPRPDRAGR